MYIKSYKTYPKEFRNENIPIQKNKCFVIMPFKNEFDLLYGNLKEELEESGYTCIRADDISGSTAIMNKILSEMLSAQFVIADLTTLNANVFYELGIAHSFKDATNVIIIKRKKEKCPFDLSHLSYIEYSDNNLKFLTSQIINYLDEVKYISDFYEMLNLKDIINYIGNNTDDFVEYMLSNFDDHISKITEIMMGNNEYTDTQLDIILTNFEKHISNLYYSKTFNIIPGVIKIYFEIIVATADSNISINHVKNHIAKEFTKKEKIEWITDLMIALAKNKKMFNYSMSWIIEYFSNSKTATIDLNRYKLERFLLLSNDADINDNIINAMYSKHHLIRESMADIIGEKNLYDALPVLYSALSKEKNNFSARSILHAISKINPPEGLEIIENWVNDNISNILDNKDYFMLRHVQNCIKRMDKTSEKKYIKKFEEKYGKYLLQL